MVCSTCSMIYWPSSPLLYQFQVAGLFRNGHVTLKHLLKTTAQLNDVFVRLLLFLWCLHFQSSCNLSKDFNLQAPSLLQYYLSRSSDMISDCGFFYTKIIFRRINNGSISSGTNPDYTVISNHHLRDKNLSLKAKWLLGQPIFFQFFMDWFSYAAQIIWRNDQQITLCVKNTAINQPYYVYAPPLKARLYSERKKNYNCLLYYAP